MSEKVPFIQYSGDMASKITGPHALQVEIHGTPMDHISLCAAAVADIYERYTRPGTEKEFVDMFLDLVVMFVHSKKSTVDVETVDYIKKILKEDEKP